MSRVYYPLHSMVVVFSFTHPEPIKHRFPLLTPSSRSSSSDVFATADHA